MAADARPTMTATPPVPTSRPVRTRVGYPSTSPSSYLGVLASWRSLALTVLLASLLQAAPLHAADLTEARSLFNGGKYAECLAAATEATEGDFRHVEGWWLLKAKAEMATGKYAEALATYDAAASRFPSSAELKLVGYDAYRMNDRPADADKLLVALRQSASDAPWRFSDTPSRVALGKSLLLAGADARQVLELFFDTAKKQSPRAPEPYLASGEVALGKSDLALAAESFNAAVERDPTNPDAFLGLARAHQDNDDLATKALAKALELNPHHVDSLLFKAENAIDQENFDVAIKTIGEVMDVNPKEPRAFVYLAVISHLKGDPKQEAANRDTALEPWKSNPLVDHLIGKKLSQNYRFKEGSEYQRKALVFAANYLPAKTQLAQDLLRLGQDEEGWKLTLDVFEADPYNVLAYNLVTLNDTLSKFKVLQSGPFRVRMDAREADLFGARVTRLLIRAEEKLTKKYGVDFGDDKVTVEVFPQQKDFAIRTFGMPGGVGFLGVCFGPLVTVNSPGSRGALGTNFEAVLWHEFCHSVTLRKTRNRMPRWLSEGISVYEERQANPAWGQVMNPTYRELILQGKATPVSKLSGAFLSPPTPMYLQFAYYESSMVVDFVVSRFGEKALQDVLTDLGNDVGINDALSKHTEPIEKLDESFAKWFKEKAENLAPKADLKPTDVALDAGSEEMIGWLAEHPKSFFGLLGLGRALLAEKKYAEAKTPLELATVLYPNYAEAGGPWLLLAAAHRGLGETKEERAAIERHVAISAEAVEARNRLIEIATAENDWKTVRAQADAILAVNPQVSAPWRQLATAAEALGDRKAAIEARRTLVMIDTVGIAENRYRLAKLLADEGDLIEARREVVRALEEAPRYRDGHKLLLELARKLGDAPKAGDTPPPASSPEPSPPADAVTSEPGAQSK
jgi:tetratricopeptide (TPR) repeat protein